MLSRAARPEKRGGGKSVLRGMTRGLWGNLLLAFLSTALILLVGEAGLRIFRPVQYLKPPDPAKLRHSEASLYRASSVEGLTYEMIPDRDGIFEGMHVRTNAFGLRGPAPAQDHSQLERLVVLGDSFTFGFGVDEKDTYPSLLQEMMNASPQAHGRHFEVLNFGVVGYSSRDEAVVLKKKALSFHPNGVIIGYVLNDPETDPRPSLHKYFDPPVWWRHSHLLRLCHLGWNSLQVWIDGGGDYQRYLHATGGEKWLSVREAFRSIGDSTRQAGAWTLAVIFPLTPRNSWSDYRYGDLHAQVAREARANGFQVVDLLDTFRRYPPEQLVLSPTDDHPNALAHRLAAEAITRAILWQSRK
jgi:lysophospholipase L1-like esterase